MASAPVPVNPADKVPELVVWTTFNLFGAFGNALLLIASLLFPRKRNNVLLMNVHLVVFVAGILASSLILDGKGLSMNPPFGICLFNAAIILSNSAVLTGAALALVAKVWSNAMLVYYPTSKLLTWTSWTPLLLFVGYLGAIPLFVISLLVGYNNPTLLFRGSTFYCTIKNDTLGTAASLVAALYSLITIILAVWTASFVIRSHKHVSGAQRRRIRNYQLVVRVLFFNVLMLAGFVCGIISVFIGFSVNWNDTVVAFAFVWAFLVFASDKEYTNLFFRCTARPSAGTSEHTSGAVMSVSRATHVHRDEEVVTFPRADSQARLHDPEAVKAREAEGKREFEVVQLQEMGRGQHPYAFAHSDGIWDGAKSAS